MRMRKLDGNVHRQETAMDHIRIMVGIGMKSTVGMEDMKRIDIRDIMTMDMGITGTNTEVIQGILVILIGDIMMMIGIKG